MAVTLERSKRVVIGGEIGEDLINSTNTMSLKKYKRDMTGRNLSPKSIYNYERDILQWFRYVYKFQDNMSVKEITVDEIEDFIYYCQEEGNNAERIRRRIASISAFYKFLRRKRIVENNPMEFLPRPKKGLPVVVQTYVTKKQYEELREKLNELGNLQLQTYAMFSFSTMARVNAVASVKWEQIDFEERIVEDVLEKEGKIVPLYFSEEVKELLLKLKAEREEKGIECPYVFATKYGGKYDRANTTTLRKWAKKVGNLIGINLHPHDFRHSYATLLVNNGMPIETVSGLLNHEGLDVTNKFYIKKDKSRIQGQKDKYSI